MKDYTILKVRNYPNNHVKIRNAHMVATSKGGIHTPSKEKINIDAWRHGIETP